VAKVFERRIKTCELPSRYRGGEIGLYIEVVLDWFTELQQHVPTK